MKTFFNALLLFLSWNIAAETFPILTISDLKDSRVYVKIDKELSVKRYEIFDVYKKKLNINDDDVLLQYVDSIYLSNIYSNELIFSYIWEGEKKNLEEGCFIYPTGRTYQASKGNITKVINKKSSTNAFQILGFAGFDYYNSISHSDYYYDIEYSAAAALGVSSGVRFDILKFLYFKTQASAGSVIAPVNVSGIGGINIMLGRIFAYFGGGGYFVQTESANKSFQSYSGYMIMETGLAVPLKLFNPDWSRFGFDGGVRLNISQGRDSLTNPSTYLYFTYQIK